MMTSSGIFCTITTLTTPPIWLPISEWAPFTIPSFARKFCRSSTWFSTMWGRRQTGFSHSANCFASGGHLKAAQGAARKHIHSNGPKGGQDRPHCCSLNESSGGWRCNLHEESQARGLALFFSYPFTARLSRCHDTVGPHSSFGCFLHVSAPAANRILPHLATPSSPQFPIRYAVRRSAIAPVALL
jgi:hypothetical protein